ncbi:hypothetical protein VOLCADRAFT_106408 [Volvox carteri f. nagariensis]|uniref:Uncharacterized protein n=1 Tax=Volvox carteri f. nagariensis TaxID=3068 RepID=D8U762_VOLCA|nr:uncharacterized protein VOLCADRAFT_106408 [Volvox carteri f. nagariensis]EFJ44427.1 hypothetical protein VOLCADRAFT_106408 [Volvox carteri f. nagariensis]|eukprot:XP_002954534.1 hypothetical protein VOLCADRAFT_106408 [Volvox carteri f. nagariensis]
MKAVPTNSRVGLTSSQGPPGVLRLARIVRYVRAHFLIGSGHIIDIYLGDFAVRFRSALPKIVLESLRTFPRRHGIRGIRLPERPSPLGLGRAPSYAYIRCFHQPQTKQARMDDLEDDEAFTVSPKELLVSSVGGKVVGNIFIKDNRSGSISVWDKGKRKPAPNFFFCSPCKHGAVPMSAPTAITEAEDVPPRIKSRGATVRDVSCAWPPDMRMHLYGMSDEVEEEEYQHLYSQFQHRCTRRREQQPNALDNGHRVSPRTSPTPAPGVRTVGPNMDPEAQHIVSPDAGPCTGYIQGQQAANPNVGHRIGGAGITGLPPRGPPSLQDDAARGRMPSGGVWDLGEIDTTGGQGPMVSWKCRRCQNRHSIIRCCACGSFARPQLTEGGGKCYTCEQCDDYDFGFQSAEMALLLRAEQVVQGSGSQFRQMANSLLDIQERRLYSCLGFGSFVQYVSESGRIDIAPRYAQALVAAAHFLRLLSATDVVPNSECQVRPLTALPPCDALGAWRLAVAHSVAESRLLSGRLVEQCALEVTGRTGSDNSSSDMDISDSEFGEGVNMVQSGGGGNVRLFLSSESLEWFTPLSIIELVREVFTPGRINLDPCSSAAANTRVGATVYYDMESDGLLECNTWMGNVFVNLPFGVHGGASYQSLFFQRCATEYTAGRIHQAVLLLKAALCLFSGDASALTNFICVLPCSGDTSTFTNFICSLAWSGDSSALTTFICSLACSGGASTLRENWSINHYHELRPLLLLQLLQLSPSQQHMQLWILQLRRVGRCCAVILAGWVAVYIRKANKGPLKAVHRLHVHALQGEPFTHSI